MKHEVTAEQIKEFWEKNPFHAYENPYKIGTKEFYEYVDYIKETDGERFSKHLYRFKEFKGKRVLDIGFGAPRYTLRQFAKNGAKVYGIDMSDTAVSSVKKALKIFNLKANLKRADAMNLPFKDDYFDFVISIGALHHALDTQECLDEVYRVLKKGGEVTIGLYYNGITFKRWFFPITLFFIKLFFRAPKRVGMMHAKTREELLLRIDGDENPKSGMFTKKEIKRLFNKFKIINIECHLFIMHFLPKYIPRFLHRTIDKLFPLMIFVQAKKV